ncbi:glycosyltransferase family 2 protein [Flavobacterium taihuense]|uniref:Glycosyltransferase family 2 protein n=1 Tax=Flavobacterium taihuense TaxID=2857508 RepID=A0ABS6XVJ7_9FLAO|nr:glycosyltransferase family A protein [Flavobacterium taihuense]MBW4360382.1 glycosyltransferase family 2 protein [Flavobacterium taihuense]
MIVVYHNNTCITRVESKEKKEISFSMDESIAYGLMQLAIQFPESKLVWCYQECSKHINIEVVPELMHHQKIMLSYNPSGSNYLGSRIGYVEDSPFININKKVSYPTWQMSSLVGVVYGSVLLTFKDKIKLDSDFDYYLNSIAKVGMPKGLLCYSEPKLLVKNEIILPIQDISTFMLFRFVKQHYRMRWVFLLFLNLLIYEKCYQLLSLIRSLVFRNRNLSNVNFDMIEVQSTKKVVTTGTIDVIIPTIGRKDYLYDVLQDLAKQTHLPINVIIVEQNPQENSVSELDYLQTEKWPFVIKHTFTHQAGACNARNLALSQVESEWVFLNDDDNRLDENLVNNVFKRVTQYGTDAIITSYLQPCEIQLYKTIHQSGIFGSGNSFVKSEFLRFVSFDKALEFGYGEDTDFGFQLRNKGHDVIYFPDLKITHLKAPIGGFRIKPTFAWSNEAVQPKPSPSMMYVKQKNNTKEQLLGYKMVLFFKLFKKEPVLNYLFFLKTFQRKWFVSKYWAKNI